MNAPDDQAIHLHFGLSYASYLTLPRTLLQSMPGEWQSRFVTCLKELDAAFGHVPQATAYKVEAAEPTEIGSMSDARLKALGITRRETDCTIAHDHDANFTLDCDSETLFSSAEDDDMGPDYMVLIPVADPVPHYNRGRTFLAPDLDAMRVAGCATCDGLGAVPRAPGARWDDTLPCPDCSAAPARAES